MQVTLNVLWMVELGKTYTPKYIQHDILFMACTNNHVIELTQSLN
jgi:hypothetical protein